MTIVNVAIKGQSISNLGIPYIEDISTNNPNIYPKFWEMQTAPNGLLYLVNENGLIEYDGRNWKQFSGSQGITRSVCIINNELIYTGSDVDFGKWEKDVFQNFHYTSLYPLANKEISVNEEFWNVYQLKDKIIFQSQHNLYVYENEFFTKIAAPSEFSGSNLSEDELFLFDNEYGIYRFDGQNLLPYLNFKEGKPISILKIGNGELIFTEDNGIWSVDGSSWKVLNSNLNDAFKEYRIFSIQKYSNNYIIIGTILNGLYILDSQFNLVQHINKISGLPNNTILATTQDNLNNLFVAMNYGLRKIDIQWPLDYFIDYTGEIGAASYGLLDGNNFYTGSNQGLFLSDWAKMNDAYSSMRYTLIPKSQGQVWSIKKINNEIWVGHDNGTYLLKNNEMQLIDPEPGTWDMVALDDNSIVTGNYSGLHLIQKEGGIWRKIKDVGKVTGSCNHLFYDTQNKELWVVLTDHQVLRLRLDDKFNVIKEDGYFIEDLNFETSKITKENDQITIENVSTVYTFNKKENKIEKSSEIKRNPIPQVNFNKNQSVKISDRYVFYGFETGFVLKDNFKKSKVDIHKLSLLIQGVYAFNNNQQISLSPGSEIPYKLNNIRMDFLIPQMENVEYRYRIDEEKWSEWDTNTELELLNQPEGNYAIEVQARIGKQISNPNSFEFRIKPPIYRTVYAYIFYVLMIMLGFIVNRNRQNKKLQKQKEILERREREKLKIQEEKYKKSQVKERNRQLAKENEELRNEIRSKNKELTKNSSLALNKNKALEDIKVIFDDLKKESNISGNSKNLNTIKRIIDSNIGKENNDFSLIFDESNDEFFEQLRKKHPKLTLNNLRLAAYIRAGFTSKEIANIQNVLPSSIIVNRSRLRKKMNLEQDDDLYDYLTKF